MRGRVVILTLLAALAIAPEALAQTSPVVPVRHGRPVRPEPSPALWKLATLRVMGGATNIRSASGGVMEWTVDMHAGLRMVDARPSGTYWIFGGDVGLSLGPRGGPETAALWLGGPGVSYGGFWIAVGWSPRFVFGSVNARNALGLRNTLSVCMFVGVACLDVSHQYLSLGDGSQHDLRLALGLDLGMLAQVIVQFANARPG